MLFILFVFFVFLPNREFTGTGESGFNAQARQNPAIEDEPGGQDGQECQ